jgi:hypothetical protein
VIRLIVAIGLLLGFAAASGAVLSTGLDETRLALGGKRRDLTVQELHGARGFIAAFGCVRHDLAVGVTRYGRVYRLGGGQPDDEASDRVFTPLAAPDDCTEGQKPRAVYALVEDDDSLGTTISYTYKQKVAPPPVPAIVSGVVGYGAGHGRLAKEARAFFAHEQGLALDGLPLLVKGKQPGVLWVAGLTAAAGVHGFLFVALAAWWLWRRTRKRATVHEDETEERFFTTDTVE